MNGYGQESNKDPEDFSEVKQLIESKKYVFVADYVYPVSFPSKYLTEDYTLTVEDTEVNAYLPYYGRAFFAEYGGSGGIEFDAEMEEYEKEIIEGKQRIRVTFKVRSDMDLHHCTLTIYKNKKARLNVTSNNRQNISYRGKVSKLNP
jgi:hypothetical protein